MMIPELYSLVLSYLCNEQTLQYLDTHKNGVKYLSLIKPKFEDVKELILKNQYYSIKYLISIGKKYTQKHMTLAVTNGKFNIVCLFMTHRLHVSKRDYKYLAIHGNLELLKHYNFVNYKNCKLSVELSDLSLRYRQYEILEYLLTKNYNPSVHEFRNFYLYDYDKYADKGVNILKLLLRYKMKYLQSDSYSYLYELTNQSNQHLFNIYLKYLKWSL